MNIDVTFVQNTTYKIMPTELSLPARAVLLYMFNEGVQEIANHKKTLLLTWMERHLHDLNMKSSDMPTRRAITSTLYNWQKRCREGKQPLRAAITEKQRTLAQVYLQQMIPASKQQMYML